MYVIFETGIEDKLVATNGYGIVVTDEASSFFQEIKSQDVKHESNIGLLNQLFDGQGDKSNFAGMRQHFVPPNSTSMSLGVQPQPFFRALVAIGCTVWQDSGFAERFLFTTVKPYRYIFLVLSAKYSPTIFGKNIRKKYLTEIFAINIRD